MVEIFTVDAFTGDFFKGNPAAVCVMEAPAEEAWMLGVAREMNLSETAFLCPVQGAKNAYNLRWFTPTVEVALCGHATLASAHILWEERLVEPSKEIVFNTLSGHLKVWMHASIIWMDLPADTPERVDASAGFMEGPGEAIVEALGLTGRYSSGDKLIFKGRSDYLVVLDSPDGADLLRSLKPDFKALALIATRGFIVTAASPSPDIDFVSRFFAPGAGIDEDPVTGSAHCTLGPYWAGLLGKSELTACQLSERGGVVRLRVPPQYTDEGRIYIGGNAITALKSTVDL